MEAWKETLTSTLGPGGERRPRRSCSPFAWSCEQHPYLILHIGVQMPQFIVGRVDNVGLSPGACGGAVFHLLQDDGSIPYDGVGIRFDPQIGSPHSQQLRGRNGRGRLCKASNKQRTQSQMFYREFKYLRLRNRIPDIATENGQQLMINLIYILLPFSRFCLLNKLIGISSINLINT